MNNERNVVIVEDNEDEARKITHWLALKDVEVQIFNPTRQLHGNSADQYDRVMKALLKVLKLSGPKVVILDLGLHESADFNGQKICRELRERCPSLGLICATVMPLVEGVDLYRDWGADYGWPKPWFNNTPLPDPGDHARMVRDLILRSASAKNCCDFS